MSVGLFIIIFNIGYVSMLDLNLQRANEQMKRGCMQENNEDRMVMRMKPTR